MFNEIFAFTKTELELLDSKLIVQVWDYDVSNRDDFLGEVIINMTTFNFKEEPVHTAWYTLKMEVRLVTLVLWIKMHGHIFNVFVYLLGDIKAQQ